ncbi:hypothetical protein ACJMK2_004082 [Sinanodonta woodiana]|uniref:DUF753 domain-containing protein n=1 Tax=Sinanodonta woodiana TaxID=1069815 RepID=A0ABD3Y1Q3_SINWO
MMFGPLPYLCFCTILHFVVEYKGVSAIRCYSCNYDASSGNDDSCLKDTANTNDCPFAWTCYAIATYSKGKRDVQDVQSAKRGCGSGDIGCSGSCSDCKSDTCYTVCKDDLCNVFDTHTNGIGARWQSTEALSMLTLSMLITFGIRLLSKYVF